jgi:hypothetical protein
MYIDMYKCIYKYESLSSFKKNFDIYYSPYCRYIDKAIDLLELLKYQPDELYISESPLYLDYRINYDCETSIVKEKEIELEIIYTRYTDDVIPPIYLVLKINNNTPAVHCRYGRNYRIMDHAIEYNTDIDLYKIDEVVKKFFED